jgi:predicted DNA-binding transcriptional regulator AlpA
MNNDFGTPDIMSRKEAAAFLGICRSTLDRLDIPRTKIGRRVMFNRVVLNKWVDDHTEKANKGKA